MIYTSRPWAKFSHWPSDFGGGSLMLRKGFENFCIQPCIGGWEVAPFTKQGILIRYFQAEGFSWEAIACELDRLRYTAPDLKDYYIRLNVGSFYQASRKIFGLGFCMFLTDRVTDDYTGTKLSKDFIGPLPRVSMVVLDEIKRKLGGHFDSHPEDYIPTNP